MNHLCKAFLSLMLLVYTNVFAQLPSNIGFEDGNFDGWECYTGTRARNTGVITVGSASAPSSRHVMINDAYKNQLDPYGGFPVLCPNGSGHSIKLGDDDSKSLPPSSPTGGRVNRISRTFTVPSNFSIIFNYAVVLEDNRLAADPHPASIQPKFEVHIIDVASGTVLNCPYFNFTASSSLPGFLPAIKKKGNDSEVIYKDWSTAIINLTNYAGKEIRLEFTSSDCAPGAHFGYAYLDIDEELSLRPISGNVFCANQTSVLLNAPNGFKDYVWYKDKDFLNPIGHNQTLAVPAKDKEKYTLEIIPYDSGCIDTIYTALEQLTAPFTLVVVPEVHGCPGSSVDLTVANITAGSSSMKFSYFKDKFGQEYLPNPDRVLQSGIYFIRGTNLGGCTEMAPVKVILSNPEISVKDPQPANYPAKVDLSTTFTHIAGITYDYFNDAAATKPLIDFSVNISGTYYIKATNGTPCSVVVPVKVVINPPPPYTIEAPNTFTPNGDGINDNFSIKTTGYVSLTLLNIFNRYGQVVFTTRSINDYWTGYNARSPLPFGTYYWVFEGTDDYSHTPMKKAASITILR